MHQAEVPASLYARTFRTWLPDVKFTASGNDGRSWDQTSKVAAGSRLVTARGERWSLSTVLIYNTYGFKDG